MLWIKYEEITYFPAAFTVNFLIGGSIHFGGICSLARSKTMKQPKSTADKALPALLIAFFAGTSGAFADELLDAPSSQGNYLLFPAEVQQERIDLQKTDRWRD